MNNKRYEKPQLDFILIENDVIETSGCLGQVTCGPQDSGPVYDSILAEGGYNG